MLDYLIANEDRHLNNFGLLRDPETLEWLGMAPIFDSGSSLGYDRTAAQIRLNQDVVCKPFKKHHGQQLGLVLSFDWLNFDALADMGTLIRDTLSDRQAMNFVGSNRVEAIMETAERRVRFLQNLALNQQPSGAISSTQDDVEENIAQDYTPKMTL